MRKAPGRLEWCALAQYRKGLGPLILYGLAPFHHIVRRR